MTGAARFWTPYRQGVVFAVISLAAGLAAVVSLFVMVMNASELALWILLASIAVGTLSGFVVDASYSEKRGAASCPSCGKSVFQLYGWTSGNWTATAGLIWPERQCSECLYDLTENSWS